jgi:hypothetical protein
MRLPNLEGQVPIFISPRNRVAQLYPGALGSLFVASYDSQGYGVILTLPPTGLGVLILPLKVKIKAMLRLTVNQSVCLGVELVLGLMTIFLLSQI